MLACGWSFTFACTCICTAARTHILRFLLLCVLSRTGRRMHLSCLICRCSFVLHPCLCLLFHKNILCICVSISIFCFLVSAAFGSKRGFTGTAPVQGCEKSRVAFPEACASGLHRVSATTYIILELCPISKGKYVYSMQIPICLLRTVKIPRGNADKRIDRA